MSFSPLPEGAGSCPQSVLWACPLSNLTVAAPDGTDGRLIVDFPNLIRAEVSYSENAVRVFPLVSDLSFNTLEHFVLDILFPRLIASSGTLVVHGALVSHGADAVCLIGDSGRGKSTLSAALRTTGWTLHGDDAMEILIDNTGITARATYPSLRLNPDALEQLFPETPEGMSPVADYLDKFRLDPSDTAKSVKTARLRAVFLLNAWDGTDEIAVRRVTAGALCMSLLKQSFALNPADPKAAHGRLSAASAVAAAVPGFALSYPRDFARLPGVMDRVRSTLDQVEATAKQEMAAPSTLSDHV